jgi:poly-gamma-glutamate synthesis protein (capsule biosynthesis protein)
MSRRIALRNCVSITLIATLLAFGLAGCFHSKASSPPNPTRSTNQGMDSPEHATNPPEPPNPVTYHAKLLAVGDIMVHMPQLSAYYDAASGRYDFSPWFAEVTPLLREGDWVVGNLETTLAGRDLGYSGYPRFNSPPELAEALGGAGINLVSTANNHSMDRGFAGIERTLARVREAGIIPYGTAATAEEAQQLVIAERNGIRMGFLAYTYGTNGIPIPEDKPFAISLIDPDRMAADIARLREAKVDAVTVSLHFGTEYQRQPNESQIALVRQAIGAGADIILGSHPHVVQPYDIVEVPAEESVLNENRRGVVIYSLGNFISNQQGDWKDVGLIFGVELEKTVYPDGTSTTTWNRIDLKPTWVHIGKQKNKNVYTIVPLRETLAARANPRWSEADFRKMETLLAGVEKLLHTYQPE